MPSHTSGRGSLAGRRRRPATGSTAAPTPDTGATTPIRPDGEPAVEERRTGARCRSRRRPHQSEVDGGRVARADQRPAPTAPTSAADARRGRRPPTGRTFARSRPPMKSETPYDDGAEQRQEDRDHDRTPPRIHTAVASERRGQLDQDADADRLEGRLGRRPGPGHADAHPLGEVDPDREADQRPDDRDHEEADDRAQARRRPGCWSGPRALSRRPGTAYLTTAPTTRTGGRDAEHGPRRRSCPPRRPRPGSRAATRTVPGMHRDHDPEQPTTTTSRPQTITVPVMAGSLPHASTAARQRRRPRTVAVRGLVSVARAEPQVRSPSVLVSSERWRASRSACRSRR